MCYYNIKERGTLKRYITSQLSASDDFLADDISVRLLET